MISGQGNKFLIFKNAVYNIDLYFTKTLNIPLISNKDKSCHWLQKHEKYLPMNSFLLNNLITSFVRKCGGLSLSLYVGMTQETHFGPEIIEYESEVIVAIYVDLVFLYKIYFDA